MRRKKIPPSMELFDKLIDFALEYPELAPDRVIVMSLSKKTLEKVLTPARMQLIRMIKDRKPRSVSQLAKIAGRPIQSVSRDLRILSFYGFLEFDRVKKQRIPKIEKDILIVPLTA